MCGVSSGWGPYLLLLSLEVEDGGVTRVADQLAEVATTTGKVQRVFADVVGEVGQTGILPALLQSRLTPLLCMENSVYSKAHV